MAISSVSTGLRPGVCTSTTRPTTPYTGQIIYETDTGYLRVWDGSAWDYFSPKQNEIPGAWTSFTPTWSFGSNTITTSAGYGHYTFLNNIIIIRIFMRYSSAPAGGDLLLTLPSEAAIKNSHAYHRAGWGSWDDQSVLQSYSVVAYAGGTGGTSTTVFGFLLTTPGWAVTNTSPFTAASPDELWLTMIGERA